MDQSIFLKERKKFGKKNFVTEIRDIIAVLEELFSDLNDS